MKYIRHNDNNNNNNNIVIIITIIVIIIINIIAIIIITITIIIIRASFYLYIRKNKPKFGTVKTNLSCSLLFKRDLMFYLVVCLSICA